MLAYRNYIDGNMAQYTRYWWVRDDSLVISTEGGVPYFLGKFVIILKTKHELALIWARALNRDNTVLTCSILFWVVSLSTEEGSSTVYQNYTSEFRLDGTKINGGKWSLLLISHGTPHKVRYQSLKGLPTTGRPARIKARVMCLQAQDKVSLCCDGSSIGTIGFSGHLNKWQLTLVLKD